MVAGVWSSRVAGAVWGEWIGLTAAAAAAFTNHTVTCAFHLGCWHAVHRSTIKGWSHLFVFFHLNYSGSICCGSVSLGDLPDTSFTCADWLTASTCFYHAWAPSRLALFVFTERSRLMQACFEESRKIKADRPLTCDTLNAPWLPINRQFQLTGNGHSQLPLAELGKPSPNIDLLRTTGLNGRA